tara:strand:- start:101 stop:1183 length:1083 start_codon:yes stop_codon:yes gene_type:complete
MKNRFSIFKGFLICTLFLGISQRTFFSKAFSEQTEIIQKEIIQKSFYILGPGDVIKIKFYGLPEISGLYKIMSDGTIQLPIIGTQNLTGFTLEESRKEIMNLYKDELLKPQIDLELNSPRPLKIAVIGEIIRPGSYTLGFNEISKVAGSGGSGTTMKGFPTVVDAIQKAGGLTFDADITNVLIYRNLPGNDNEFKKAKLDLLKLIRDGKQENNPILFDGDVIEISKINDQIKSIEKVPTNLTPETIKLYVIGEVSKPGMYEVAANTQINQAILIAGGPNNWRSKDKVELLRVKRNGSIQVKKVNFSGRNLGDKKNKLFLRNGDIVKVNKNLFAKSTDALGNVIAPIQDAYTLYGITKLLD